MLVATEQRRELERRRGARACAPRALPGARHPRRRTTRSSARRAGSRSPSTRAASSSCSRAPATRRTCATRSRSTCCCATSSRRRRRRRAGRAAGARRKRALYISSPIGLGHAQRDVAIADELRKLHPDLEIDWLAQHPVTARARRARRARSIPASAQLANESRHIESESAEHDLHCFQAIRRMDEILLANFMVFHDLVRDEHYDLWIGDEAWELDYYLHENPEQKRARVRLADRLRRLAADARRRRARGVPDRRLQRGDDRAHRALPAACATGRSSSATPTTSSPTASAPELPSIRDWTARALLVRRLRDRLRPGRVRRPRGAARGARLPRRRAGLHRHRRRLRRRRPPAASGDRGVPAGAAARAGAADGRRRRSADRPGSLPRARRARGARATSTSCTGTSPPATSRSCRAG